MAACEMCWYLADQDVQLFGGSVVDHYHRRHACHTAREQKEKK